MLLARGKGKATNTGGSWSKACCDREGRAVLGKVAVLDGSRGVDRRRHNETGRSTLRIERLSACGCMDLLIGHVRSGI